MAERNSDTHCEHDWQDYEVADNMVITYCEKCGGVIPKIACNAPENVEKRPQVGLPVSFY